MATSERITLSAGQLVEAQRWIADCEFGELVDLTHAERLDYIAELPTALVERTVANFYDGGVAAFVADARS